MTTVSLKLPSFATMHIEHLEPSQKHDKYQNHLPFVAPSTRKSIIGILAIFLLIQPPLAAISSSVPNSPIGTVKQCIYI